MSVLGLGDVSARADATEAIAAVFDLEGFTNFCKQIDPQLSVPKYLYSFLSWLMERLRDEMRQDLHENDVVLWSTLPFFVKFLGDGLLVLWDASTMDVVSQRNVIVSCAAICRSYRTVFLTTLKARLVDPPRALRCGIARGTVFSVGKGLDYVGSCINMAARLQKLPGISFCFNCRGFELEGHNPIFFEKSIVVKQVAIRGIGERELVGILKSEGDKLGPKDRKLFKEP